MDLRKIDALVAEHVMGWWGIHTFGGREALIGTCDTQPYPQYVPRYSADVASAWEIVEKLSDMDPQIIQWGESDGSWSWFVDFEGTNSTEGEGPVRHRDIATAICLAALKAKGIDPLSTEPRST